MVVCEKCRKEFKKMLEVRWMDLPKCSSYFYKRFDSVDDLMRWVEQYDKGTVVLKVVKGNVKSMEGQNMEAQLISKKIENWYSEHIIEIATIGLFMGIVLGSIALSKYNIFI